MKKKPYYSQYMKKDHLQTINSNKLYTLTNDQENKSTDVDYKYILVMQGR